MAGRGAPPRIDSDDEELSAFVLPVSAGPTAVAPAQPLSALPLESTVAVGASLDEAPEDGPGGDADEDEDEDALFAEKIKLLQEENARLRAAAATAQRPDSPPPEQAPDASAAGLTATATAMADWLVAAAKEQEKAVYEAAALARAAERESVERSARATVLAQVDSWTDQAGHQSLTARPRDGGATPASVAALRVHVPKPQALTDGASAVLARLESQFGASPARHNVTPGRVTAHREGAAKDRAASLTAAVDDLEKALARSAAVMAVTAAGGGRDAAGMVAQAARQWQTLPPQVRRTSIVVLCVLFFLVVFFIDFFGSEEDQQEELLDRGVVFNVQAKMMEVSTLSALAQAGTDNAVQASQAVREAARGIGGGALRVLLSQRWRKGGK